MAADLGLGFVQPQARVDELTEIKYTEVYRQFGLKVAVSAPICNLLRRIPIETQARTFHFSYQVSLLL